MRLIFIEGAPGIGKSTLAWELCRKWEEFSCMQQYNLVVLLRLREEKVQNITKVSELFYAYGSEDKKSLEEEIWKSQGKGILFILDGFDEFPKNLQRTSFLLDLIKGYALPDSTVLVTSRPSAIAQLLTCCRPQKRVEILGFTQESVETYASSVFVAEPEKLEGFKAYISVSNNPAISSLMYVPLNAAIVVQIYRSSKSDSVLPHTLTELYTQLCLTILNRYLDVHHPAVTAAKFEDLPCDLYTQFLKLCKVAFEGMENEMVIFNLHSDFNHFGFLDAVSALYGGGEISYNFLHLTLQEFLAAYHISQLGDRGPELFEGLCGVRWNVVWRFVAGLTKFKHLTVVDMERRFVDEGPSQNMCHFFIKCLFEAKTIEYFSLSIRAIPSFHMCILDGIDDVSAFVVYALGYCIANIHTGKPWCLQMTGGANTFGLLKSGLKTNVPGFGVIKEVSLVYCQVSLADIRFCFPTVEVLRIVQSKLIAWDDSLLFSNYILHNTSLTELEFSDTTLDSNFLLLLLQQLCHSNVTSLDITKTSFCEHYRNSRHDFYPVLKKLTDLSSGKLRTLRFGDFKYSSEYLVYIGENDSYVLADAEAPDLSSGKLTTLRFGDFKYSSEYLVYIGENDSYVLADAEAPDDDLVRLVSSPSSLESLTLRGVHSSLFPLESNTCLTELNIRIPLSTRYSQLQVPSVIDIVKYNKTLQHLEVVTSNFDTASIDNLEAIAHAVINQNTSLQSVKLILESYEHKNTTLSEYLTTHKELTVDPRITWSEF